VGRGKALFCKAITEGVVEGDDEVQVIAWHWCHLALVPAW
jgi:hypothetical protein